MVVLELRLRLTGFWSDRLRAGFDPKEEKFKVFGVGAGIGQGRGRGGV